MAKVKGPLFGLSASGTIGHTLTYSSWKGIQYVKQCPVPLDPNSPSQQIVRGRFTDIIEVWHSDLWNPAVDRNFQWNEWTRLYSLAMSGFNYFCKAYLLKDSDLWHFAFTCRIVCTSEPTKMKIDIVTDLPSTAMILKFRTREGEPSVFYDDLPFETDEEGEYHEERESWDYLDAHFFISLDNEVAFLLTGFCAVVSP